jgi:BASS family bile acid:Na+ symporter
MNKATELDAIHLNFSSQDLLFLNLALALIMFGIALELKIADFKYLVKNPKGIFLGLCSQLILLPFLTWCLVLLMQPPPSVALGMFLVAACPGGNVSNFLTNFAKGNTALSISLTGITTILSIFTTPLNFAIWAGLYEPAFPLLKEISIDYHDVFITVSLILGGPLVFGILVRHYTNSLAVILSKILKPLSLVIFSSFVIISFVGNLDIFLSYVSLFFIWVLVHNSLAFAAGYFTGKIFRLPFSDIKTLTIETGIQNSGLGLVLIFTYFDGMGGMALIAAAWGIWHLISGISLASFWKITNEKPD